MQGQAENVSVSHPVYQFLKRLGVKGLVERFDDAVLPFSRKTIAGYLDEINNRKDDLTRVEKDLLADYVVEFEYDLYGTIGNTHRLINSPDSSLDETVKDFFSEKEKYLYVYTDSSIVFFVDGLLTLDTRQSRGDALDHASATFVQFGGRIRGSIDKKLGIYLHGTNAQFWGSRDVLRRDKIISQSYALNSVDVQNFDHIEGYVRYDGGIVAAQVGRERVLWGNGYGDKVILSDNIRQFDFIRAEAVYKAMKYTFLHAWLLGKRSQVVYALPSDPSYSFVEPVNADKYFAGHRLGLSFPHLLDVGFQEMVIYSNRSPDLAYLNPVTLIESAQRSRGERDNVLWAFDFRAHFIPDVEVQGTVLLDDLNFPRWGTGSIQNKNAFQLGALWVDALGFKNSSWFVEYTRVEPYTFSHNRSRDNDYGSGGQILGHHIGPNSDSWFFRFDYYLTSRLVSSVRFEIQREGENIYDGITDTLIQNVGGDFLQPHRSGEDSDQKEFLGGNFVKTHRLQALLTYEIVNEVFLDARYEIIRRRESVNGVETLDHDFGVVLRIDF